LTLENLLDNLLLFNQESTNNTVSDTVGTAGTTIGTANGFLGLGDSGKFTRTESLDLQDYKIELNFVLLLSVSFVTYTSESFTTVTTAGSLDGLLLVVVD
jgi:hypothetical protein